MTSTLLMEIDCPDYPENLRFMCGGGFEILEQDLTGRDVYGFSHNGKDYLLFPLEFAVAGPGLLEVAIPVEYEEWFSEYKRDGARIFFFSPHGIPFFTDMPAEYDSGSGVLRVGGQGELVVMLDKRPGPESPFALNSDPEQEDGGRHRRGHGGREHCACGHDCGHEHEHDPACEHERRPEGRPERSANGEDDWTPRSATARRRAIRAQHDVYSHGGHELFNRGAGEHPRPDIGDRELADEIRWKVAGLNRLLHHAADLGLIVELDAVPLAEAMGAPQGCVQIEVTRIARPL